MIDGLADLLADSGFRAGLLFGLLASVGLGLPAVAWGSLRRWTDQAAGRSTGGWSWWGTGHPDEAIRPSKPDRRRGVRGWAGLAIALAAVLGLAVQSSVPGDLTLGLLVLGAAGVLAGRRRAATRAVLAVPGAWVVASAVDVDDRASWMTPAVVLTIAVGGALVGSFDRRASGWGLGPLLLAVTALGAYVTTPDTEHVVILAGAALPVGLLSWARPPAALGPTGSSLAVALLAWAVAVDGAARPGAVVGGLACLGMLVLEPVARRFERRRHGRAGRAGRAGREAATPWPAARIAALHAALVLVCSRVAGLRTSAAQALAITAVACAATVVLFVLLACLRARQPTTSS